MILNTDLSKISRENDSPFISIFWTDFILELKVCTYANWILLICVYEIFLNWSFWDKQKKAWLIYHIKCLVNLLI